MKAKHLFFCVTVFLMVFLAACSSSQPGQTQTAPAQQAPANAVEKPADTGTPQNAAKGNTVDISLKSFKFVPVDVDIKVGDTVVWTNRDSASHTVTSSDGTLDSDELVQGDTYSYTFTKPGKYDYNCGIHPSMRGSVTVQ